MVNLDHVLSTVWKALNENQEFKSLVPQIVKGISRPESLTKKPRTPTATVHLLAAPMDGETDAVRCTVIINIYADDTSEGYVNSSFLGNAAHLVTKLFHKNFKLTHPDLDFKSVLVQEPLIGLAGHDGEHFASIKIRIIVKEV